MNWLVILIIIAIIGGIIGAIASNDGEKSEECLGGMFTAGTGCGYILLQIFLWEVGISIMISLFGFLFGGCKNNIVGINQSTIAFIQNKKSRHRS